MPQPKSKAGYRLGIVNPLTLVGNEVKTILRERNFPFAKVTLLDSTGKADRVGSIDLPTECSFFFCNINGHAGNGSESRSAIERLGISPENRSPAANRKAASSGSPLIAKSA